MGNFRGTESDESRATGPVPQPGSQALLAAAIGAAALSVVMVLILLAARQAPRAAVDNGNSNGKGGTSRQDDTRALEIDDYAARAKIGPLGSREVIVEGSVKNTGSLTVEAADLRCYFMAASGDEVHFDFPLVVDSSLDDLGEGPLPPKEGRNFSVRVGDFPDGFASKITRIEVINVRLEEG